MEIPRKAEPEPLSPTVPGKIPGAPLPNFPADLITTRKSGIYAQNPPALRRENAGKAGIIDKYLKIG
jgi:hypothetical protein